MPDLMSTILPKFTLYSALNLKTTPDDTNNALAILLMFLPLTDLNSLVNGRVLFFSYSYLGGVLGLLLS